MSPDYAESSTLRIGSGCGHSRNIRHSPELGIVAQGVGMNPVLKARPLGSTLAGIPDGSGSDGTIGGVPGSAWE
jgi:hypothetical protein